MVLSDRVEVAGMEFRRCSLRVPSSSGEMTVGGCLSCLARVVTTSAFRCLGTETTGFSGTLIPLSFMKFGTIRLTNLLYGVRT